MAMAPTQKRREAVTKPWVKVLPPPLLFFSKRRRSLSPQLSRRRSMSMAWPMRVPTARQTTTQRVFSVLTAEEMPMLITHRPMAWMSTVRNRSGSFPFSSRPRQLPARIRAQLMIVASIGIVLSGNTFSI